MSYLWMLSLLCTPELSHTVESSVLAIFRTCGKQQMSPLPGKRPISRYFPSSSPCSALVSLQVCWIIRNQPWKCWVYVSISIMPHYTYREHNRRSGHNGHSRQSCLEVLYKAQTLLVYTLLYVHMHCCPNNTLINPNPALINLKLTNQIRTLKHTSVL